MRIYEAFFLSLLISMLLGAIIFFCIPYAVILAFSGRPFLPIDEELLFIPVVFFSIYAIIQFWLSAINAAQVFYWQRKGMLDLGDKKLMHRLLGAEAVLYIIVFAGFVFAAGVMAVPFVLLFSIPYIIFCTVSI